MKKLGLRAVAGSLALLLTASAFAPATTASAADMLVTAKAPKTLVITADMVDDDGEIVISNEDWDCIIVGNGVDAKNIYFDGVEVKELVVESGSKTKVQLWDVDAAQVTVQEPEFEAFPIKEMLALLTDADDRTRQQLIDKFNEYQANVNAAKKLVPSIATKEGAEVEALVVHANAKLDLGEGAVDVVALEAGEKVSRANVTLSNYNGDVTYKGGEGFSAMTLKTVNSDIKNLKVEDSNAENYFTVTAQNAKIAKTEVAGNAKVSLNAPMGEVEITEAATAANVSIMNEVNDLKVAGKGAKVDLAGNAEVKLATVTSDDVKISGAGSLAEADLQGKGGYVSIFGTKVEGENTYVPYTIPVFDSWTEDFSDAELVAGVPTDGGSMNWAKYSYDAENKYGIVTTSAGWQGFAILLDNRDNGSSANYTISLRVKKLGGVTEAVRVTENPAWTMLADLVSISDSWTYIKAENISVEAGGKRVIMIAPEKGQEGITMELAVDDVTVERYTEWTEPKGPEISKEAYTIAENFSKNVGPFKGRGGATASVKEGAMYVSGRTANWHGAEVNLDKEKTFGRTLNVSFKVKYDDDTAGVVKSTLNTSSSAYAGVTSTEIAKADEWVTVTGTMTVPSDAEYVTFYFEADSTTASFYIDDVVISTEEITDDMLPKPDEGDSTSSMKGKVNFSTKHVIEGDAPTESEGSLVFTAKKNKCAFDLPETLSVGEKMDVTVDFDFTTLDTNSTVRFYLIKNRGDVNVSADPICIRTGEVNSTSVKTTFTMEAVSSDATQILFVTYAHDGSTPQVVTLNGITIGAEEEEKQPAPEVTPGKTSYDFEDGVDGVTGCGATFAQAETAKTGKNVWKLVSAKDGYAAATFATKLPEGKSLADIASVRFDYYIVTEGIQYKPVKVLMGTELANDETTWNTAVVNKPDTDSYQDFKGGQAWNVCTTDLVADAVSELNLAAGAEFVIGIGMMGNEKETTYYIDNVRLVDVNGDEFLLHDFEEDVPTFGVVNNGMSSSASSTVDSAVYGASMLQITNANWGQGVSLTFTLPSNKTIADYSGLKMNIWLPTETYEGDSQKFTYKDFRINAGTGDNVALPEGADYVGWKTAGNQGSWVEVTATNWDALVAAIGDATTFKVSMGVNTSSTAPYYIDNVTLIEK